MTDHVKVSEGTITLPTYPIRGENPNPVFESRYGVAHIYPYTLQIDIDSEIKNKQYQVLFLENKYLKVTVIPDLGGRVYSVFDKISQREVFYKNTVVKFSPLAIRGAFFSGGVEFSFPVAHAPTTCDPVNWDICNNDDGSASISIGGIEHISRLKWIITLTLYPDHCALSQDVALENPNGIPGRYHYWTNASLDADENTEFIYPFHRARSYEYAGSGSWPFARIDLIKDDLILPGMEGVPMWPANNMQEPINFRWQKNMLAQVSIFGRNIKWDYFGAWQHSVDHGYAHVANCKDVAGMKLWSWGNMPVGVVNQTALTDDGSEYAETQCGAMETQLDFDFLQPYKKRKWREWWLPIRGMGGLTCASELVGARLSLIPVEKSDVLAIRIAACPVLFIDKCRIILEVPDEIIFEKVVDLSPVEPWHEEFRVDAAQIADKPVKLTIVDKNGETVLHYINERKPEKDSPEPSMTADTPKTAQDYLKQAIRHENFDNREKAKNDYRKAIELDGSLKEAHLNYAVMLLRSGQIELADKHLLNAQNEGDLNAVYFRGLISLIEDRLEEAGLFFQKSLNSDLHPSSSAIGLAKIRIRQRKWQEALPYLEKAEELGCSTSISNILAAVAHRLSGNEDESEDHLQNVLVNDPINLMAIYEFTLTNLPQTPQMVEKLEQLLNDDFQYAVDLACFYMDLGLSEEAIEILKSAWLRKPYAVCAYLIAYLYEKAEDREQYQRWLRTAQDAPMDFVFPSRLEEFFALETLLKNNQKDSRLMYYLGNFLYAHERFGEAIKFWEDALSDLETFDVIHRNLGLAYWERHKDPDRAMGFFETALELNTNNQDIYIYLDDIYRYLGAGEKRQGLLQKIKALPEMREDIRKRIILILVDLGNYQEALNILETETFMPLEMDQSFHDLYVRALMMRAENKMTSKDILGAIEDYKLMLEYPENLGVGRPTKRTQAKVNYLLGNAYEKIGKYSEALASWHEASSEHHSSGEELFTYVQMALDKISRYSELGLS